jgi:hypothetical protein
MNTTSIPWSFPSLLLCRPPRIAEMYGFPSLGRTHPSLREKKLDVSWEWAEEPPGTLKETRGVSAESGRWKWHDD